MKNIKFGLVPTFNGIVFTCFIKIVTVEEVFNANRSYIKLVGAVRGHERSFLIFRYTNTTFEELVECVGSHAVLAGYVNIRHGYFLVVQRVSIVEEKDFDPIESHNEENFCGFDPLKNLNELFESS